MMEDIVICTIKSWNIANAIEFSNKCKEKEVYQVHIIRNKEILSNEYLKKINPRYVFFPHWSWMIPAEVYENYECIVFHMTDLPFGRGGSPLQNLIVRKIYDTKITAFRVTKGLDEGPIYLKIPFNISQGNADNILRRTSHIIFELMIPKILSERMEPQPQKGQATFFERRNPDQSNINKESCCSLNSIYDFIRMLDGEGYPPAFLNLHGGIRHIRFFDAHLMDKKIVGWFEID